jgi:hypothetical protein
MTEQLKIQITQVSNKLEDIYGEHYSKQYDYAINDIQNKTSIATTHIIVDLLDLTINDEYLQLIRYVYYIIFYMCYCIDYYIFSQFFTI